MHDDIRQEIPLIFFGLESAGQAEVVRSIIRTHRGCVAKHLNGNVEFTRLLSNETETIKTPGMAWMDREHLEIRLPRLLQKPRLMIPNRLCQETLNCSGTPQDEVEFRRTALRRKMESGSSVTPVLLGKSIARLPESHLRGAVLFWQLLSLKQNESRTS